MRKTSRTEIRLSGRSKAALLRSAAPLRPSPVMLGEEMKKIIGSFTFLLILAIFPFLVKANHSETKAFQENQTEKYFTKGHFKAKGINISIKYPNTWKKSEGERPNIVQKFTRVENDGTTVGCFIGIHDLPKGIEIFSEDEIAEEMFSKETIKAMILPNSEIIQNIETKYDGQPGALTIYATNQERMGLKLLMYTVQHMFLYSRKLIGIECSIGGLASNHEKLKEMANQYTPLFKQIGISVVIHDKWESSTSVDEEPIFGEYWWLVLIISALLTLGVGLLPPILIRFVFARKPLSRKVAIVLVCIFGVLNLCFFIAVGNQSKTHAALFLVAVVSYYILRAGHEKLKTSTQTPNNSIERTQPTP